MSPTEDDLRAALRQGEGDPVDANRVLARGHAHRVKRRTTMLSGAAAAVFVGALATGVALVTGNDTEGASRSNTFRQTDGAAKAPAASAPSAHGIVPDPGNDSRSSGTGCPAQPTHQLLPGGGSPGQFGSDGKLFPKPVATLVVCGYTTGPNIRATAPGHATLAGDSAATVVASLENAAKNRPSGACPDYETAVQRTLVFIGITADGSRDRQVVATLRGPLCRTTVTNGTALRYAWTAPKAVSASLQALTPNATTSQPDISQPGGGDQKHGSPVR